MCVNISALLEEDEINMNSDEFKSNLLKKYDLLDDDYWTGYFGDYRHPIREVWLYSLAQNKGTYKLLVSPCIIEVREDDFGKMVKLWYVENWSKKLKPGYTIQTDTLEELYALESVVVGNRFFSLEKKSDDEVKAIFAEYEEQKLVALQQKINKQRANIDRLKTLSIETAC